ncbi:hypothetical protein J113_23685 [Mycobacterium tuberculosis CAS/NITR204]|uniref:Antitoxin n=1 Tax=Mycobacterium tuberculosis CAS/NITR204 TaxID=1310114 RepID=R4MLL7_MYCTX|nr:hypothetical protein J113_23685 [Mycobacterium tuberculosis CAS/NITR204]
MTSVGVRALRQRASELLRRVEAGETIEITDRGRPVALLSPLPQGGPYEHAGMPDRACHLASLICPNRSTSTRASSCRR